MKAIDNQVRDGISDQAKGGLISDDQDAHLDFNTTIESNEVHILEC